MDLAILLGKALRNNNELASNVWTNQLFLESLQDQLYTPALCQLMHLNKKSDGEQ